MIPIARRLALAAALLCAAVTAWAADTAPAEAPIAFTFPDLNGKPRALAEWRGKVVLLNFWAPWCPPCVKEIPNLVELQRRHGGEGLQVVGITIDTGEHAANFTAGMAINYPLLVGEDQGIELAHELGDAVGALPYTVVLDREGHPLQRHAGGLTLDEAEALVRPALEK